MVETEFRLVDKQRVKTLQVRLLTSMKQLLVVATDVLIQSQLKASITEKDEWKRRAKKFEDALETLKIINRFKPVNVCIYNCIIMYT